MRPVRYISTTKLSPVSRPQIDELRASLQECVEVCPVTDCNCDDCPLFLAKHLSAAERGQWFNALNEEELIFLATYHHVLMKLSFEQEASELPVAVQPGLG